MMFLSIITPTFNRDYTLPRIYASLQTNDIDNFEWLIVDDGSQDNTEEIVSHWMDEKKINIRYYKQENQGKTNALVTAFELNINGKFSVVLDSDDVPVEKIVQELKNETDLLESNIIGIVGLKSDLKGKVIGTQFKKQFSDYVNLYFGKNKTVGDKLFIVKTEIYRDSLVSSFNNEKLIPESVFYLNMAKYGLFKCINKVMYSGDYLEDGLSADRLKLAAKNINGFIFEKKKLQSCELPFFEKVKNELKYISYSLSGEKSFGKILKESNNPFFTFLLFAPTYFLTSKRIEKIKNIRNSNV